MSDDSTALEILDRTVRARGMTLGIRAIYGQPSGDGIRRATYATLEARELETGRPFRHRELKASTKLLVHGMTIDAAARLLLQQLSMLA